MVTRKGGPEVRRFMAALPGQIEDKLIRGAARAAIGVVKEEAAATVTSDHVREALTVKAPKPVGGRIEVKLTVVGQWAASVGNWLEWGTAPHIIRASTEARAGRSIGRMNRQAKEGSLVIGGKFVGEVVHHPGAQDRPFLRVSLDLKAGEAIAAAQSFINARVGPAGISGSSDEGDDA